MSKTKTSLPTEANNFFETLKDHPEDILEWCDSEIKEYQKLKRLIKKSLNKIGEKEALMYGNEMES